MEYRFRPGDILAFSGWLRRADRAAGTIYKYTRDVGAFARFLDGRSASTTQIIAWKQELLDRGYAPRTINSMLAACNGFFRFKGYPLRAKFLRVQRQLFRDPRRELSREEYTRLLRAAQGAGRERLALIMETLAATGIRVGELRYITVEAARQGRATIALKGKIRTILLPRKLCRRLLNFARKAKIAPGEIFLTGGGRGISRRQVWHELKSLCAGAAVEQTKVFPHNFRHLFATVFYQSCKDIARLADVLGHSSIETTRIYLTVSGAEQLRQLDSLGLVL